MNFSTGCLSLPPDLNGTEEGFGGLGGCGEMELSCCLLLFLSEEDDGNGVVVAEAEAGL